MTREERRKILLEKAWYIYSAAPPEADIRGIMANLAEWADANPVSGEFDDLVSKKELELHNAIQKLVSALEDCTYDDCGFDPRLEDHETLVEIIKSWDAIAREALDVWRKANK
jgi:hypothetical protein